MMKMKSICPICGKTIETENITCTITPKFESATASFICNDKACGAIWSVSVRDVTEKKVIRKKMEEETQNQERDDTQSSEREKD